MTSRQSPLELLSGNKVKTELNTNESLIKKGAANLKKGIETKIHYPIPIYRQPAMKFLKHKKGDFPVTERHAKSIISFPCDQHLSKKQMNYIIKCVNNFYSKK